MYVRKNMNVQEGKYLVCITRSNGDFYQYYLTDDVEDAVDKFVSWKNKEVSKLSITFIKKGVETRGIVNTGDRPHLYLIDTTFTDDMVLSEKTLASEMHLKKFKRIKRLYQLNVHLF